MTKRKLISLSLALTLLFALASCGNKDIVDSPAPGGSQSPSDSQSPEPSDSQSPEPGDSQSPEPGDSQSPEPSDSQSPEPSESSPAVESDVDLQKFFEGLVVDDIESENYFNPDVPIEGELLTACYPGLEDIATRQRVIYQPGMSGVACEIALVEVENADDVQKVKDIFQARIDYQVGTDDTPGGAWYPESIEQWKNDSRIVSNGNYLMLIVWSNCDQFVEDFNALF